MLVAQTGASPALLTIAEHFFDELRAFGCLGVDLSVSEDRVQAYVEERGAFIRSFYQILESSVGLKVGAGLPYCYNTAHWPNDCPIAGFAGSEQQPPLSDIATSLILNWNLDAASRSTAPRLLKVALWIAQERGLANGVAFLFDLLRGGFVLRSDALAEVVLVLIWARAAVKGDDELARQLLGGRMLQTPSDWMQAVPSVEWVQPSKESPIAASIVASLITRVLREMETVRDSQSWDDWLIGLAAVGGMVAVILDVAQHSLAEPPFGLRSVMSRFEEIHADVFGFARVLERLGGFPHYRRHFGYARLVSEVVRGRSPGEWPQRFFEDRLLVPRELQSAFGGGYALPDSPHWDQLTWRLAHPYAAIFLRGVSPLLVRSDGFGVEELLAQPEVKEFFRQAGVTDLSR